MKKSMMIWILFALLLGYTRGISIPSNWKTCEKNDPNMNSCLKDAVASALVSLIPGNPKFNIRPLDPLHLDNATFVLNEPDVKMTILFNDLDVFDFVKTIQVKSVVSNWKTMIINLFILKGLHVTCNCRIPEGNTFMGYPINGDGPCEFHYDDTTMSWRLKFSEKDVGGTTHYNVEDFDYLIDTDKLTSKFENLYNGNTYETEKMNKILNDHWEVFWNALKHEMRHVMSQVGRHSANKVFSSVPKNEITPR